MAGNILNRYLWLINLLVRGPISYKEISEKWETCSYNDKQGEGLPLKTFHNHCNAIAEIFGVDVECKKKGDDRYGYYIGQPAESEVWKFELLNQFLLYSAIKDSPSLSDRVMNMDSPREEMPLIIECIQKQSVISFVKPGYANINSKTNTNTNSKGKRTLADIFREKIENGKHYTDFLVLSAIKVMHIWFVIGAFVEREKPFEEWRLSVFTPGSMKEIKLQYEARFESAKNFSLQKYIDSFVFDPSDLFDDDRAYLDSSLSEYRERRDRIKKGMFAQSVKEKQISARKIAKRGHNPSDV